MTITKEYRDYILEQLNLLDNISYKSVGKYLLYYHEVLFGGIYDDRLLIKKKESNKNYELSLKIPYDGAKFMYQIDYIDNQEELCEVIINKYNDLK